MSFEQYNSAVGGRELPFEQEAVVAKSAVRSIKRSLAVRLRFLSVQVERG